MEGVTRSEVINLIEALSHRGVNPRLSDGQIKYKSPPGALSSDILFLFNTRFGAERGRSKRIGLIWRPVQQSHHAAIVGPHCGYIFGLRPRSRFPMIGEPR
jgi:hypothetical protein